MYPGQLDISKLAYEIAANDCEASYRDLFLLLYPKLKRFAFCILKSTEYAEEIASDVLISIWRNRSNLLQIQNLTVYAYVIAKNLSLNLLKKNFKKQFISIDELEINVTLNEPGDDEVLITEELKKNIETAIANLPPRCKLVFKLVKEECLSYKETAEILGISIKTVDAQLVTAIKKITQAIKLEYNIA